MDLLESYVRQNQIPGAFLLVSDCPEEGEKRIVDFILAATETPPSSADRQRERLTVDGHPDFHRFEPGGKSELYTVETIREISEQSRFYPQEEKKQFFLLLRAECMQEAAANAFLKTLEEPTPETVFILMTAHPEKMLPTILSRLPMVTLSSEAISSSSEVFDLLGKLLEKPRLTYTEIHGFLSELRDKYEDKASREEMIDWFLHVQRLWQERYLQKESRSYENFLKALDKAIRALRLFVKPSVCFEYLFISSGLTEE